MKANTSAKHITSILAVLLTALLPMSANAEKTVKPKDGKPGQWRLIGTTHVDQKADHDTITVKGPSDDFRKIKFKVTNAPLELNRMVVTYDNGEPDKIEVREKIPKGGESRVIDLKGPGKRSLKKIEFWYEAKGLRDEKADVTIVGMK